MEEPSPQVIVEGGEPDPLITHFSFNYVRVCEEIPPRDFPPSVFEFTSNRMRVTIPYLFLDFCDNCAHRESCNTRTGLTSMLEHGTHFADAKINVVDYELTTELSCNAYSPAEKLAS